MVVTPLTKVRTVLSRRGSMIQIIGVTLLLQLLPRCVKGLELLQWNSDPVPTMFDMLNL